MAGGGARTLVALLVVAAAAACGGGDDDGGGGGGGDVEIGGLAPRATGPVAWDAPPAEEVGALAEAAGVPLETHETLIHHAHSHVDVFIDGEHRSVPAGIGIVITDPAVRTFEELGGTSYGGIEPPCEQPCISPLHTHDASGVIHTESATNEDHTLGQLFDLWDVRLTDTCIDDHCTPDTRIGIYVDGDEVPLAEASDIPLVDGTEIAIIIGDPPDRIPAEADFSLA